MTKTLGWLAFCLAWLSALWLLVGCTGTPAAPAATSALASATPWRLPTSAATPTYAVTPSPMFTRAPAASHTPLPVYHSPTPAATWTRSPTRTASPTPVFVLKNIQPIALNEPLHDVILFTNDESPQPFSANLYPQQGQSAAWQLWAFSPDGLRLGRLTAERQTASFYAPPGELPILLSPLQLDIAPSVLRQIPMPADCTYPSGLAENAAYSWIPCSRFLWSADGRWVSLAWQEERCILGFMALDARSGKVVYQLPAHQGAYAVSSFLPGDKLLLFRGHCEGGAYSLLDLKRARAIQLGSWGEMLWSPDHSAFAVTAGVYQGMESSVWAYDLQSGKLFLPEPAAWGADTQPLWTPDGAHLLYLHRSLEREPNTFVYNLAEARQIILVDAASGAKTILASDPAYDYHLCEGYHSGCAAWRGDWVQVRRTPFTPQSLNLESFTPQLNCLMYGSQCSEAVELLALNWRTGELLPWDEAQALMPPENTLTPGPAEGELGDIYAPDLTLQPVYTYPGGAAAFYVGKDGHTLWLVPSENPQAAQFIAQGSGFIYIP